MDESPTAPRSLDEWIERSAARQKVFIDLGEAVAFCRAEEGFIVAVEGPGLAGRRTTIIEICEMNGDFAFGWTRNGICIGISRRLRPLMFASYTSALYRFAPHAQIAGVADAVLFVADRQKARAESANYWALELAAVAQALHGRRLPVEFMREPEPWSVENDDAELWAKAAARYADAETEMPMVVQLNKSDLPTAWPVSDVLDAIGLTDDIPHVTTVATKGVGLDSLFELVLSLLDPTKRAGT